MFRGFNWRGDSGVYRVATIRGNVSIINETKRETRNDES